MTVGTCKSLNSTGVYVVGAVVHHTGRVLAIQVGGDHRWQPPGGRLGPEEAATTSVRRHVRCMTGFEITEPDLVDEYDVDGAIVLTFRCEIRGVGSDIAADTHAMRWLTRADVCAQPRGARTRGLLRALDAPSRRTVGAARVDQPIPLAG